MNEPLDDRESDGISTDEDPDTDPEQETGHLEPMNRFEGLMVEVNNIISCLYKFSITIRNPASSDKLERCSKVDVSHLECFDIQLVREKYPGAETYLCERLGRANTKRRQLLKYHAQHHRKIAAHYGERSQPPDANVPYTGNTAGAADATAGPVEEDGLNNLRADATQIFIDTTVSTAWVPGHCEIADHNPDTNFSQTAFAASEACGAELLCVPDPPGKEAAYKHSFECPYCHQFITVTGETAWV